MKRKAVAVLIAIALGGCARTPEQKFARYMASGRNYLEKKDYARAGLEFRNAMQAAPKNPEAYYSHALVSLATGDVRNGIALLRKTTELDPKHRDAQLKLAQLMAGSTNKAVLEEAERRVRDVLASSPANPDALNTLAIAEWRLGRLEEAEEHLQEALKHSPQNLRASFNLARARMARKDLAGAEKVLQEAVTANPKSTQPVLALGAFYVVAGRPPEAERQYRRMLEMEPGNGLALASLAGLKLRAGRNDEAEQLYKQASASKDDRYQPLYAMFLLQSGKQEAAIAEFERLSKASPNDRQARSRLVTAYLNTDRAGDAEKVLAEALKKNAKDLSALLQQSQLHLRRGKYAEAQEVLTRFLHLEPNSAQAHYLLAKAYEGMRSTVRQREELGKALKLAPGFLAARIELAQLLVAANAAKNALELMNEAPAQQKNTLAAVLQQNWIHLALGDNVKAGEGIKRVLAAGKNADVLVQEGVYALSKKEWVHARQCAEEALKLRPEELRALEILMQSYSGQKQPAAGIDRLRAHVVQHPRSAGLQAYLGQQLLRAGEAAGARNAFEAATAANPKWLNPRLALAQLDTSEGKLDSARSRLTALIASDPSEPAAYYVLASLEERAARYTAAVEHYRKGIALDDRNVAALNNLAFLLAEHGNQLDEALQFAEKARQLAPESPHVLDTIGWIHYRKGAYVKAVQHLELAVGKEASGVRKAHLAVAYVKAGDRKRGLETIADAVKSDPAIQGTRLFKEIAAEIR